MNVKKSILTLILSITINQAFSQLGLEGIVVEKYYISDAADSIDAANNGAVHPLHIGSTTYRVYANLLPGYKVIQMFGNSNHTLNISTTTAFYNDPNYGFKIYQGTSVNNTKKNTTMIDSYITIGGVANGLMGVLKSEDTDGSIGNLQNILANNDPLIGLPITGMGGQDGLMPGLPILPNVLGITNELDIFDQTVGTTFTTNGAAIAALGGIFGVTASNHVLLGQFTTDGVFSFHLNLQIATPIAGESQIFVSDAAGANEYLDSTLNYTSEIIDNSGLEENAFNTSSITIYPNPTNQLVSFHTSNVNMATSSLVDVKIFDLSGRNLLSINNFNLKDAITVDSLNTGVYNIVITNGMFAKNLTFLKN